VHEKKVEAAKFRRLRQCFIMQEDKEWMYKEILVTYIEEKILKKIS